MSGLGFALLTFVCTLGGALFGMAVRSRLPAAHLSKESQDVIRLGMGLVATMTALLLGLVTAAAKGSYDSQDVAVRNAAAGLLTMDRMLARYGPETQPIRDLVRRIVAARVEETWGSGGGGAPAAERPQPNGGLPAEDVEDQILRLAPETDAQRWLKAEALKVSAEVLRTRWRLLGSAAGAVPKAFLAVVIFWLAVTFASFGVGAPRNATVLAVFVVAAFSVAAAVFLIFELDGPLDGLIKISSEPLRQVLANLGR